MKPLKLSASVIPASEIENFLAHEQTIPCPELEEASSILGGIYKCILVHDNRILLISQLFGQGLIYQGIFELFQDIERMRAKPRSKPTHYLSRLQPFGKDFPRHSPELVRSLFARLGMGNLPEKIVLTTLRNIDAAAEKIYPLISDDEDLPDDVLFILDRLPDDLFPELLAVVGEALRNESQGEWKMEEDAEFSDAWEPTVQANDGRTFYFSSTLYSWCYEKGHVDTEMVGSEMLKYTQKL